MNDQTAQPQVLVVDDDRGLLRLIEKALRRDGFSTRTASSGQEAITWLTGNRAELILLDLKLQDIEGKELIQHLSTIGRLGPFVVITGQGDERVAVEMMKRGALDYLVKDANFLEFVPRVARHALQQIEQQKKLARTELELQKNRELLAAVVETTSSLIVVVNDQGGIVLFNRACEELTGYPRAEALGKSVTDLALPEDWLRALHPPSPTNPGGPPLETHEHRWATRSGEPRLIEWRCTLLPNSPGERPWLLSTGGDITERKRLETEILRISDLERRRIGQDLHDGICQQLAGIELMGEVLEQNLAKKSKPNAEQAARITEHVRETVAQTRLLVRGLSPVELESEGLMSALLELASGCERMFNIPCALKCDHPVLIHDNETATHLYRIAQEAVNNAAKHAGAKSIEICLESSPQKIILAVRDDGAGYKVDSAKTKGMGLRIMKYRSRMIGGALTFQSEPNQGTQVVCTIPRPSATGELDPSI